MRLSVMLVLGLLVAGPTAADPAGDTPEAGIENPSGSVPAHLNIHLSQVQDSILSPLPAPPELERSLGAGVATHSACVPLPLQTFTEGQHHTWYNVLSTAEVRYDGGTPHVHAGAGPAADIAIDPATPLVLTWFLEVRPQAEAAGEAPVAIPRVVLEAQLREGDDISVDHRALEAGRVVASGRTAPATLSPALSGHPEVAHVDAPGRHIYAFRLVLEPEEDTLVPREEGMHLRIDAYIDEPACQEGRLMPDWVHPYTGPGLRPGLDLAIEDPVRILRIAPRLHNGTLSVQADVAAPWGLLDVHPRTVGIQVEGPQELAPGPMVARSGSRIIVDDAADNRSMLCHCYPEDRVEIEQLWDLTGAADGRYTVRINATNHEGNAVARAQTTFELPGGAATVCRSSSDGAFCQELTGAPEKESPAATAVVVLLLGLAAAHARRRR